MYDQSTHMYLNQNQNMGQYPNKGANVNQNMAMGMGGGMNMGMGVGMGMGGFGMMGMGSTGGIFNGMFMYKGNPVGLSSRMDSITYEEASSVKKANIICDGVEIKQINLCCFIFTFVCGSFLIFPLCFMCCDWWKRLVYPQY